MFNILLNIVTIYRVSFKRNFVWASRKPLARDDPNRYRKIT